MLFTIPPSDKQIRYAKYLSGVSMLPLPAGWDTDRDVCGSFIASALRVTHGHHPKYTDEHTRRIESGGPLINDPEGPWNEAWCQEQERLGKAWWPPGSQIRSREVS